MVAPQPSEQQQQQPPQAPEPRRESADERILTPEETENLLRGFSLESEQAGQEDDTPPEQRQMAQEFFAEIPPERRPEQMQQALPPRPPEQDVSQPPAQPSQEFVQQAAQQMQAQQPPQQVPVQTQVSPEMAAIQAQNRMLTQQINLLQQQIQHPQPQPQPAAPSTPAPAGYNFQIPQQFMAALQQTENPGQANYALNTILNHVAESITQQLRQENAAMRSDMENLVQSRVSESGLRQEIQRDMYGTYPELSAYREYVQAAVHRLGSSMPQETPWSPDLRDAIAEQVSPFVPGLYQKVQQIRAQRVGGYTASQQQQQQSFPQQQQPAGLLPPGVRPVGVAGGAHLARDAQGNLVHVQGAPQPYLGSPQARQSGRAVSPEVADIWRTLGYEPY